MGTPSKPKIAPTELPLQRLRPGEIERPDIRARSFRKKARIQAQAAAASAHAAEDQAFIDAISVVDFAQAGWLQQKRTE